MNKLNPKERNKRRLRVISMFYESKDKNIKTIAETAQITPCYVSILLDEHFKELMEQKPIILESKLNFLNLDEL